MARDAKLVAANLSGAELIGTFMPLVDISGADLSNADLSGAGLTQALLIGVNLQGAKLSGVNMFGANLSSADLRDADLTGAILLGSFLNGADLRGTDLSDAIIETLPNVTQEELEAEIDYFIENASGMITADRNLLYDLYYNADMSGVRYNDATIWPEGFAPPASAVKME